MRAALVMVLVLGCSSAVDVVDAGYQDVIGPDDNFDAAELEHDAGDVVDAPDVDAAELEHDAGDVVDAPDVDAAPELDAGADAGAVDGGPCSSDVDCAGGACTGGVCTCPSGRTWCAPDGCVDTSTDERHCWGCGNVCEPPTFCYPTGGRCGL